jgi:hypothetical protein
LYWYEERKKCKSTAEEKVKSHTWMTKEVKRGDEKKRDNEFKKSESKRRNTYIECFFWSVCLTYYIFFIRKQVSDECESKLAIVILKLYILFICATK